MESEARENLDIEIIDEGIEAEIGPEMACCWGPYSPMLS